MATSLSLPSSYLNLAGALDRARYDALVSPAWRTDVLLPGARSVLVLGNGGPAFFRAFQRQATRWRREPHPLDAFTVATVEELAEQRFRDRGWQARSLFYFERRSEAFADFVALGRAAGLGVPSRLSLLLHPEFGPWLAIRALVLTDEVLPPTPLLRSFAPCEGCPAPCASVCPGAAIGTAGLVAESCRVQRSLGPPCAESCRARRACVLGQSHVYDPPAEAFHARAVREAEDDSAPARGESEPIP